MTRPDFETPWIVAHDQNGFPYIDDAEGITVIDPTGFALSVYPRLEQVERAALIVRAVNSHDRLLAAAKALAELDWCIGYELLPHQHEQLDKAQELARAAIAEAEGDGGSARGQ